MKRDIILKKIIFILSFFIIIIMIFIIYHNYLVRIIINYVNKMPTFIHDIIKDLLKF